MDLKVYHQSFESAVELTFLGLDGSYENIFAVLNVMEKADRFVVPLPIEAVFHPPSVYYVVK